MKKLVVALVVIFAITFQKVEAKNNLNPNLKIIEKPFTNVNAFCTLIRMGDVVAVKALIDEGVDINRKSTGLTPLMFAARYNKVEIVKLLIENGAKLNVKSDRLKITALRWAELSNAKECYKVIKSALEEEKLQKKQKRNRG